VRPVRWLALLALGLASAACGGSSGGGGSATCTPSGTAAIAITAKGTSPQNACVTPGGTVTFTNNDTTAHQIEFGAADCPANLASIPAGGQVSPVFPTQANCLYHDALNASNTAFQGTVAVSNATVSGGGY